MTTTNDDLAARAIAPSRVSSLPTAYVATRGDNTTLQELGGGSFDDARTSRKNKIKPKRIWKQFAGDTLTTARMNSVRTIAVEEPPAPQPTSLERLESWASSVTLDDILPAGGSLGAAIFGIIKGTVGPAILYLPRGFQVSGYAVGIPSMIVATLMYIYNAYMLLACWSEEKDKDEEKQARLLAAMSESGNMEKAATTTVLLTYPELAKRAFGPASILVDVGIASLQFGVCLTYLIFVPHNLYECTNALLGWDIPKEYFLWGMILVEIPLSWIRDIRKLTPTNVVATVLIAYGLFFVLVLAFIQGMAISEDTNKRVFLENLSNLPAITDSWFLFVGTSFFMMEGSITLLVPLQESLRRDQDREKFPQTNQNVTACIVAFYVIFSIICCGAFGDSIHTALTASLDGTLAITIQLAYSLAVVLTFPLQAFPAMEVAKSNVLGEESSSTFQGQVLSTLVIFGLGIVAIYAIDYLGNVVSILGSLFGIPLALVVPPLMYNTLVTDSPSTTRWTNYGVVFVGFMAMGAASFATIVSWDKGAEGGR